MDGKLEDLKKEVLSQGQFLMNEIAKLYSANERWTHEIVKEVQFHFETAVENIRHDLLGANHVDIESIKIRVTRLEQHTHLVP